MKIRLSLVLIFSLLLTSFNPCFANGALLVTTEGKTVSYGSNPLIYRYDKGKMGMFTNTETIAIFEELFDDWRNVSTANVMIQKDTANGGFIPVDVNGSNFSTYIENEEPLGYSPIVFDDDGGIIDGYLGAGSSKLTLGFAGPAFTTVTNGDLFFKESFAVFNGKFINGISNSNDLESSVNIFKSTVLHELGHAIGLDHSQINVEALDRTTPQSVRDAVPLMFPVAVNDLFDILRDDQSGVSLLYPNTSALASFGEIEGQLFKADGSTQIYGANIVARNINNPTIEAVSCISGYLGNSSKFRLVGLPPGDYRLEIEPINSKFTGGSSVGHFSDDSTGLSFQDPVIKGYFAGSNMLATTNINDTSIIHISAGQKTTANILSQTQSSSSSSSSTSGSTSSSTSSTSSSSTSGTPLPPNGFIPTCNGSTPVCSVGSPFCPAGKGTLRCGNFFGVNTPICDFDFAIDPDAAYCGGGSTSTTSSSTSSTSSSSTSGTPLPPNGTVPSCSGTQSVCATGTPFCPSGKGTLKCINFFGVITSICDQGFAMDPDADYCGGGSTSTTSSSTSSTSGSTSSTSSTSGSTSGSTSSSSSSTSGTPNGTFPGCSGATSVCSRGVPSCPANKGTPKCINWFGVNTSVCDLSYGLDPDLDYCTDVSSSSSSSTSSSSSSTSGSTSSSSSSTSGSALLAPTCVGNNVQCPTGTFPACPSGLIPTCGSVFGFTGDLAGPGCTNSAMNTFDHRTAFCRSNVGARVELETNVEKTCDKKVLCPKDRKRFENCREDRVLCDCICPTTPDERTTPRCDGNNHATCSGNLIAGCNNANSFPVCYDGKLVCHDKITGAIDLSDKVNCK